MMPLLSSSTWRSMISEASAPASWWRVCARRINSRSNSGERWWTRTVSFSGLCSDDIVLTIYITAIEIENAFGGWLHFSPCLRVQPLWANLETLL